MHSHYATHIHLQKKLENEEITTYAFSNPPTNPEKNLSQSLQMKYANLIFSSAHSQGKNMLTSHSHIYCLLPICFYAIFLFFPPSLLLLLSFCPHFLFASSCPHFLFDSSRSPSFYLFSLSHFFAYLNLLSSPLTSFPLLSNYASKTLYLSTPLALVLPLYQVLYIFALPAVLYFACLCTLMKHFTA